MAASSENSGDGNAPQPAPPGAWTSHRESVPERVLRVLRNRRWAFLAALIVVPVTVAALTLAGGASYKATTTLLLRPDATAPQRDRARDAATGRGLLALPSVAQSTASQLGASRSTIEDHVQVKSRKDSDLVNIEATGGSAQEAIRRANAYAREGRLAVQGSPAPTQANVVQPALSASNELRDGLILKIALGLVAGALLGLLLAYVLERLDRRIKTLEELEEVYGLPVLARVPRSRTFSKRGRRGRDEALTKTLGFSEEAEAFRALRTNLRYFNVDQTSKSVLVVSPVSGDGKSTVARFLAITMASMGDSVVLVDADLRKQEAGVPPAEDGLSLVLAGFDLDQALTEVPITFDAVSQESRMLVEMPSGPLPPNPGELLESARMRWVIGQLERRFDYVIIDSPALITVSDALSLVPQVSGVLVVGGFEHTTRRAAMDLRKQLSLLQARPLGVVANFFSSQKSDYYYDYDKSKGRKDRSKENA